MALLLKDDRIEIMIPNSEAMICAQHNGIKDRTVGSYYMSDIFENVKSFLNNFSGNYYIDFSKTFLNMNVLYEYISNNEKVDLFKSCLIDQYSALDEVEDLIKKNQDTLIKVTNPSVNDNEKYLKLDTNNKYIKIFETLLLGDLTYITIRKIGNDTFIIDGSYVVEYKEKIERRFMNI